VEDSGDTSAPKTSAAAATTDVLPVAHDRRSISVKNRFRRWFFEGIRESQNRKAHTDQDVWYKVMCLTGLDYFSSLGYAPSIAFLAAGVLSPMATAILVLLTLFGALPIYRKVAEESPHGQGSISMLERLLPRWKGKILVLALLGFAATDFVITMTLSAADAATHLIQNPVFTSMFSLDHLTAHQLYIWRFSVTAFMLAVLGGVFLKGFREAIGISVGIVSVYLVLNAFVVVAAANEIWHHPQLIGTWQDKVMHVQANFFKMKFSFPWAQLGLSCILFPKIALGMSGFETGVAVMPHVKGDKDDNPEHPAGRIKHTRWLLITAASIMSTFLLLTSLATTVLIPESEFSANGAANGRALAYLAHKLVGPHFGTFYDIATILILWFAGASAMAGLLNLVPRYLPRYGMAPNWARATRPLVCFFTVVAFTVTWLFKADVDAQGGAYATGVLVLMTSAALASTLVIWAKGVAQRFFYGAITAVFIYTTVVNSFERPDGIKIATAFIVIILITSLISRVMRSTELRIKRVVLDEIADQFVNEDSQASLVRIVAHRPGGINYRDKEREARLTHNLEGNFIFLEVSVPDASEFSYETLEVHGVRVGDFRILRCESAAVPNTIAALLMHIRDKTGTIPHLYVGWTEGNPIVYILKYLFFGEGETAPVTREILRETVHDPERRPRVHVG
jgi:hypothetical protein